APGTNHIKLPDHAVPTEIVIDPDDNYAYVADDIAGAVYVIDVNPSSDKFNRFVKTIPIAPAPAGISSIALSTDGRRFYVAAPATNFRIGQPLPAGHILVVDADPNDVFAPGAEFQTQIGSVSGVNLAPSRIRATSDPNVMVATGSPEGFGFEVIT